jgi:hypothetical protein
MVARFPTLVAPAALCRLLTTISTFLEMLSMELILLLTLVCLSLFRSGDYVG